MIRITFLLIFICEVFICHAQVLRLRELNKPEDIRSGNVAELYEQNILGSVVIKHYKKFDEHNRVVIHERYNAYDSLQARFEFTYSESGSRKISGKYMTRTGYESMQYVEEHYQYNPDGVLFQVVRMNRMQDTLSTLEIIMNAQKGIIRVNEYGAGKKLISSDPSLTGSLASKDKIREFIMGAFVFSEPDESKSRWKYNSHNDLIRTSHSVNKWEYDDRGNWINLKVFSVTRGSKALKLEQRRTIVYR